MNCPVCNGPMWDNRNNKKNPKAPDWKCKNKECLDDKGFVTAVWEHSSYESPFREEEPKTLPKAKTTTTKPITNNEEVKKERSMLLSYCKDITVAQINNQNPDAMEHPFKYTLDGFKAFLTGFNHPFDVNED